MTPSGASRLLADRYRLGDRLGRGGMGTVWSATDELLGRTVAVKEVVPPDDLSREQRAQLRDRILREARAAARISSPSAVTVYDVVEDGGEPWVVMELLPHRSLQDILAANGPLPPVRVAAIGLSVLAALEAAHAAGVLHRDVKPANVMVPDGDDGPAVLTDFGIARVDGDPALTGTGLLVGSPAYMAPERARGGEPTASSDLWSLGATLYEAVEGRSPFARGTQIATLLAVIEDEPAPPQRAGDLAPVLARLLAKEPAQRPTHAELRDLLAEVVTGPPEARVEVPAPPGPAPLPTAPAQPLPAVERPFPPRSRRTRAPYAAAAALLVALAGLVAVLALRPDGTGDPATGRDSGSVPSAARTPTSTPSATPSRTTEPTPSGGTDAGQDGGRLAAPAGFRLHEDPTGFSVAVPQGWRRSVEDGVTYFREPDGARRFLLIDQTSDPAEDALADWQENEAARADDYSGYQRVRLERVDYRDYDAADWEFTYDSRSGTRLHVLSRNVRVDDDSAYAIYLSLPDERWQQDSRLVETVLDTFQPAP